MPQPLLFPLNRVSPSDVASLQAAVRGPKLLQPAFMRQRPQAYQALLAPPQVNTKPWNTTGLPGLVDLPILLPGVVHQLLPYPPTYFRLTGTTKDSTGAVLANCTVDWFDSATHVRIDTTTSDANGFYEFRCAGQPPNAYFLVAYLASTGVAGTTRQDLTGV